MNVIGGRRGSQTMVAVGVLMSLALGCTGSDSVATNETDSHLLPAATLDFTSAAWSWVDPKDQVVATVNGASITAEQIRIQRLVRPDQGPAQVLEQLVEMELMAQKAQSEGLFREPRVVERYRKALVRRYVLGEFEPSHTADKITLEEVKRIYAIPNVRKLYDHAAAWHIAHLMFTCCDPKLEDCGRAEVVECFALSGDAIHRLYEELKPRVEPVMGDAKAVDQVFRDFRRDMEPQYRELSYRQHSFFYDVDRPHDQQKGYNIFDETLAQLMTKQEAGVVLPPVQSSFGWHIPVVLDSAPKESKTADDPSVIADIRKNALPMRLKAWFRETVMMLRGRYDAKVVGDVLARLER